MGNKFTVSNGCKTGSNKSLKLGGNPKNKLTWVSYLKQTFAGKLELLFILRCSIPQRAVEEATSRKPTTPIASLQFPSQIMFKTLLIVSMAVQLCRLSLDCQGHTRQKGSNDRKSNFTFLR